MDITNKIFVQIDNERIELTGKALEEFLADRTQMQVEAAARQIELDVKSAALESAVAKLSALGLTEEEINAIKN